MVAELRLLARFSMQGAAAATSTASIDAELFGVAVVVPQQHHQVTLSFPPWTPQGIPNYSGWTGGGSLPTAGAPNWVDTEVLFDSSLDESAVLDPSLDAGSQKVLRREIDDAGEACRAVVIRLRAWIRVEQPWIGTHIVSPKLLGARVELVSSGLNIDHPPYLHDPSYGIANAPALTQASIDRMVVEGDPEPADEILAEAHAMALWVPVPDPQRAVLFAAMACELKVKTVLRRQTPKNRLELLDVVIGDSRPFPPQAAHALFTSLCDAALGRSLAVENKGLSGDLQELFKRRNRVVHRGYRPTNEEARKASAVGRAVFEWLLTL